MPNHIRLAHSLGNLTNNVTAVEGKASNPDGQPIRWLGQTNCCDPAQVGGKAANLGRLALRYPVPAGFCLTAQLLNRQHPADYQATILHAYTRLEQMVGHVDLSVAVRSSGIDEDGKSASFAGQYETFLNVRGAGAVLAAVEKCLHSAFSPRAMEYRLQAGLNSADIRLAVLVQQLVPADVSAVIFSANPVNGNREETVITANWGLGESVVGGTVTPDTYIVHRSPQPRITAQIKDKARMTVPTATGTHEVPVPRLLRNARTLTDTQLLEMTDLAAKLQREMGYAVDLECAWHQAKLFLLQCRPIHDKYYSLPDSGSLYVLPSCLPFLPLSTLCFVRCLTIVYVKSSMLNGNRKEGISYDTSDLWIV